MSANYELRQEDGEVVQCDSCNFPAATAEFDWGPPYNVERQRPKRLLCEFCATTMAGRHTEYPSPDEYHSLRAEIWKASAAMFNMLRQAENK